MKLAGRRSEDRPSTGKRPSRLVLADQLHMAEAYRRTPATRGTLRALLALTTAAVVLAGCATAPESTANDTSASALAARALERRGDNTGFGDFNTTTPPESVVTGGTLIPGTGNFINQEAASAGIVTSPASGDVTLNFELADLRDVVKVIFDTLEENYVIDPAVQGVVTVQTSRPLPRDALIPTLESLLRMNGAALIQSGGLYRIVPANSVLASGLVAPSAGNEVRPGYGVRIIPLKYISATEMEKILLPFAPEGGVVSVDNARSLIMLSGTSRELASLEQTVEIFDVNWLEGMSVGIYRLENIDAASAAEELGAVFGEGGDLPISGMLRFVPVSQLNSLLVITPQQEYLKDVQGWIDRLDGGGGERLYVYDVENGQAGYLADVLNNIFGGGGGGSSSGSAGTTGGDVAPGLESTSMSSDDSFSNDQGLSSSSSSGGGGSGLDDGGELPESDTAAASTVDLGGEDSNLAFPGEDVRIVADEENNALLIWATDRTYQKILDALRRVDVQPRQVLVEVTVAEVTLRGQLRYGLQWFFKNDVGSYGGGGSLGLPPGSTVSSIVDGLNAEGGRGFSASDFAYAITDSSGVVRALFQALESDNSLNILSSPQVMVVDNQTASIRVGNQEPVQGSTSIIGDNQINSIQFKDTGVLLKVRPRVNSSGQIMMDVRQQVIDKGAEQDQATGQFAFFERSVESRVVVGSGETIILGGLISESRRANNAGIPVLYKVPVIGPLFGQVDNENNRTELIVLITPRIVRDGREAQQVTEELKQRMRAVTPYVESASGVTGG